MDLSNITTPAMNVAVATRTITAQIYDVTSIGCLIDCDLINTYIQVLLLAMPLVSPLLLWSQEFTRTLSKEGNLPCREGGKLHELSENQ